MQTISKRLACAITVAAALLGLLSHSSSALAQSAGVFTRTADMTTPRSFHTATSLANGKVLITGGDTPRFGPAETLSSAELYDPSTGTFSATGNMITARRGHTATLLPDGRVLIVGLGNTALTSAELYDPSTGIFTATGNMIEPRSGHTAILLPTGKVLIVGGYGQGNYPNLADAELYDPDTGTFAPTGGYAAPGGCDFCASSTLLADGRVLFPSQAYAPQLYNSVTGTFSVTTSMNDCDSAATLLMNGKVLFAGGEGDDCGRSAYAELYDPTTGIFVPTGRMASGRVWHTLTLLRDGTVLVAGGETDACTVNFSISPFNGVYCVFAGSVMSAELYNPATGTFSPAGDMTMPRETHTATLLDDGRVLIAGGMSYGGIGIFSGGTATAELYTPTALTPAAAVRKPADAALGLFTK